MAIAIRSSSSVAPLGFIDVAASPAVASLDAPTGMQVGDYYLLSVVYQSLTGAMSETTPPGFTLLTSKGTTNNRLLVVYGRSLLTTGDLTAVATTPLRAGGTSTRVVGIGLALTGVNSATPLAATGSWVVNNSTNSGITFNPVAGASPFYMTYTNNAANTGHPTHLSTGGQVVTQEVAYGGMPTDQNADTTLSIMLGGTGASFSTSVANTGAIGISLNAASSPPAGGTPGVAVQVVSSGVYKAAELQKVVHQNTLKPLDVPHYQVRTHTVTELLSANPFYAAHRGSGGNWPEHTMHAYRQAINHGMKAIEVSVRRTSDGVFVCHHDAATTRMTGQNYTIATTPWSTLQSLTNTVDETGDPNQARRPIPRLSEVLDAYAATHVIFIEAKVGADASALLDIMDSYPNAPAHFIWKQWGGSNAGTTEARSRGYTLWGYMSGNEIANLSTWGPKFDLLGISHTSTDSEVQTVVSYGQANGKRTIMWEIHDAATRNRALTLGVSGLMTANIFDVLAGRPQPLTVPGGEEPLPDPGLATAGLFFTQDRSELQASAKKVLAHYFPPYPVSLDDQVSTSDYYARNYLAANGEGGIHASSGGHMRNRPQGRAAQGANFQVLDMRTEVTNAYNTGLDGFFVNTMGASGQNWDRSEALIQAASEVFPAGDFKLICMVDANGSMAMAGDVDEVADRIAYFAFTNLNMPGSGNWSKSGGSQLRPSSYFLPDGRYVVASFKCEGQTPTWWNNVFTSLKTRFGLDVAFVAVYNNINQATNYDGFPWTYTTGNWGDGADPNIARNVGNRTTAVRSRGEKFCGPISAQNLRTNSTYANGDPMGDEAYGFGSLREHWLKAIREDWEWTQLVTWNDYSEGSEFNLSAGSGYCTLDISSYYIHRLKTGAYPTIVRDAIYIAHRDQPWNATITGPQTKQFVQWDRGANMSAMQDTVEVLTFFVAPATVTVIIGGVTHTYTAPAGMKSTYLPLGYGTISATAVRSGTTVSSVTSPITVIQSPEKDDWQYFRTSSIRGSAGQFDPQVQTGP
jgi:hypothetical protein